MKIVKNYDVSPELEKEVDAVLLAGQKKYEPLKDVILENNDFDASLLFTDEEE